MKLIKFCSVIVAVGLVATTVQAEDGGGLFVEPGVTYEFAEADANYPGTNSSGDVEGLGLLARLGFHVSEAFFAGVDGRHQFVDYQADDAGYDEDAKGFNIGPMIGVQMPDFGLRIWGTYVLAGNLDPDSSGAFDVKFEKPTGFRIGVGWRLASVSLNIEYQDLTYDEVTLEQLGPFAPGTSFDGVELESQSWVASVSFPLEL